MGHRLDAKVIIVGLNRRSLFPYYRLACRVRIIERLIIWLVLQEKVSVLLQEFRNVHAAIKLPKHRRGNGFTVRAVIPHPRLGNLILIRIVRRNLGVAFDHEDNAVAHSI